MNIYTQNIVQLTEYIVVVIMVWFLAVYCFNKRFKRSFRTVCFFFSVIAVYGIFSYTVFGRTPSEDHVYTFCAAFTNEFYREMFMNILLYIPFGLAMSVLIGPWTVILAFAMSGTIEFWQYCAGTGLAQGTDLIMNTLGAAIGVLPWLIHLVMYGQKQ